MRLDWINAFYDLSSVFQPPMTSWRHGMMSHVPYVTFHGAPLRRLKWLLRFLRPIIRRSIFSGAVPTWLIHSSYCHRYKSSLSPMWEFTLDFINWPSIFIFHAFQNIRWFKFFFSKYIRCFSIFLYIFNFIEYYMTSSILHYFHNLLNYFYFIYLIIF